MAASDRLYVSRADLLYCPLEWQKRGKSETATGYGVKLRTPYKIRHAGRRLRMIFPLFSMMLQRKRSIMKNRRFIFTAERGRIMARFEARRRMIGGRPWWCVWDCVRRSCEVGADEMRAALTA